MFRPQEYIQEYCAWCSKAISMFASMPGLFPGYSLCLLGGLPLRWLLLAFYLYEASSSLVRVLEPPCPQFDILLTLSQYLYYFVLVLSLISWIL